jgi:hypothetical protein
MKYLIFIANQYVQHTSLQRPYTPKYPLAVILPATSASHPYMPKGAGTTGSSSSKNNST